MKSPSSVSMVVLPCINTCLSKCVPASIYTSLNAPTPSIFTCSSPASVTSISLAMILVSLVSTTPVLRKITSLSPMNVASKSSVSTINRFEMLVVPSPSKVVYGTFTATRPFVSPDIANVLLACSVLSVKSPCISTGTSTITGALSLISSSSPSINICPFVVSTVTWLNFVCDVTLNSPVPCINATVSSVSIVTCRALRCVLNCVPNSDSNTALPFPDTVMVLLFVLTVNSSRCVGDVTRK